MVVLDFLFPVEEIRTLNATRMSVTGECSTEPLNKFSSQQEENCKRISTLGPQKTHKII